jgi:predicted nuclease with RNAse H fold
VIAVEELLSTFKLSKCASVELHEPETEVVLAHIKLIDCWAVDVPLALHAKCGVRTEELVLRLADANACL